jgi:hypothetical protein
MRLRTAVAAGAATAAIVSALTLLGPAGMAAVPLPPVPGGSALAPHCGDLDSPSFPIETRVHGGLDAYPPGGDWQSWEVDLRNTTSRECRIIHPVVVLVDRGRRLTKEQIGLEFYDGAEQRWRAVGFETTDQDEHVGVFDGGGFEGFAVEPHRTLTVKVRMRFAARTAEGHVTATVAVVQRRDDDGDWIGESNDYGFRIRRAAGDGDRHARHPDKGEVEKEGRIPAQQGRPDQSLRHPAPGVAQEHPPAAEADALARTGSRALLWLAAVGGACVAGGVGLLGVTRRRAR